MPGLSFLSPLFLLGALAIAVPIALHLFQRRTEKVVPFAAVRLMHGAPVEEQHRRRLRERVLLALRVSALLLLAFAFARPYLVGANSGGAMPMTVVAVDVSMSVSGRGQFDAARALAREAIDDAPATHLVAVVRFDDHATVVAPPSSDRGAALAAIDGLEAGVGGTRFRTALSRAAEVIGPQGGRLVVVTDLQRGGWDASDEGSVPDGLEIVVRIVPAPEGNLAVTSVRREADGVAALVHNYGERLVRVPVRLAIDGQAAGAMEIEVAAQASGEARFAVDVPARGALLIEIDDRDGYPGDNRRYAVLDPPPAVPVLVLTAEAVLSNAGLYLQRALEVAGGDAPFEVALIDGRRFSASPSLEDRAAVFISGTRSLNREGREALAAYLQSGGQVFLTLGPDVDIATLRDTVGVAIGVEPDPVRASGGATTLVPADTRHPVFRPFSSPAAAFGDVDVTEYRQVREEAGWRVLARFAGGAVALAERPVGAGRLVVFASDLDTRWNQFPLNPAFVPFVVEMARYLTSGRQAQHTWTLPEAPPGHDGTPGIVEMEAPVAGGVARRAAVNVDVRESNPAAMTAEAFDANLTRRAAVARPAAESEAREQEAQQRLWQFGLLVMLVALAGESFLGRRAV
ncbi:MAG: VWA domain-containing protein [Vicinamibacterales bacterium]|nr:VWA domain-containing protein [Vicinamibacterales bacterium]